jgi:2'-hydroxyisoflavone reductase
MSQDRRQFLRNSALVAGALAASTLPGGSALALGRPARIPRLGGSKLRILVLGGTSFIGPYQVQYAMDRGHEVTLFNRGRTNTHLFPTLEKLVGDRENDLKALEGRTWDVVIDNAERNPDWVERSAKLLAGKVGQYIFISSRSAYFDTSRVPMTADAPVMTRENTPVRDGQALPYGLAKAESEKAAMKYFPTTTTVVRPGLIIGPGDLTDRFTYWPVRIERGGEILAPGDGTDPVQIIDVRDLCEWTIRLAENRTFGIFNGVGPAQPRPMAELLYGIKAVVTSDSTFTWVDADFLIANRVRPYQEMPVWRPARDGFEGFARFDLTPEVKSGLTFRSLADTTQATLDFYHKQTEAGKASLRAGLAAEREVEVLKLWKERRRG